MGGAGGWADCEDRSSERGGDEQSWGLKRRRSNSKRACSQGVAKRKSSHATLRVGNRVRSVENLRPGGSGRAMRSARGVARGRQDNNEDGRKKSTG